MIQRPWRRSVAVNRSGCAVTCASATPSRIVRFPVPARKASTPRRAIVEAASCGRWPAARQRSVGAAQILAASLRVPPFQIAQDAAALYFPGRSQFLNPGAGASLRPIGASFGVRHTVHVASPSARRRRSVCAGVQGRVIGGPGRSQQPAISADDRDASSKNKKRGLEGVLGKSCSSRRMRTADAESPLGPWRSATS